MSKYSDVTKMIRELGTLSILLLLLASPALSQQTDLAGIIAFTGQSPKGPADSVAFLKLADSARDLMPGPNNQPISAAGRAQGIAIKFGKGRVIVMGEAAMLSAQLITGSKPIKFGMNRVDTDNRQLALNIMHWLSGLLR